MLPVFQIRGNNCRVSLHPQNWVLWSPVHKSFAENGVLHAKSVRSDLAGPVSIGRFSAMNEWNCVFHGASWMHPAGERFLWAAATGNVSASNTSKEWGWLLPCLGNAGTTRRTVCWKSYVIIPDKSLVGRCLDQVCARRVAIEYGKMHVWSGRQFCKHKAAFQMLARKSGIRNGRVDFCCGTNFSVVVPEQERRLHLG